MRDPLPAARPAGADSVSAATMRSARFIKTVGCIAAGPGWMGLLLAVCLARAEEPSHEEPPVPEPAKTVADDRVADDRVADASITDDEPPLMPAFEAIPVQTQSPTFTVQPIQRKPRPSFLNLASPTLG